MTHQRISAYRAAVLAALILLVGASSAHAASGVDGWVERTFRVTGSWDGDTVRASALQLREPYDDARRVQVTARAGEVDERRQTFAVGPLPARWSSATKFERVSVAALRDGRTVRVAGELREGVLEARSIRAAEEGSADAVQVTAMATSVALQDDGAIELIIGGVPVRTQRAGYNAVDSLTRRQDSRRPASLGTSTLFERPITVGGEVQLATRDRRNFALDPTGDDVIDLEAEFQVEALYEFSDTTFAFASGKALYEADIVRAGGRRAPEFGLERDQTWVFFDRLFGSGFGLQVGRQNFKEAREWWWDDDLDAARLYYDRSGFHAELAIAKELAPVRRGEGIDPEQEGVKRVLAHAGWLWAPRQKLEAYFLHADDGSRRGGVGSTVARSRRDSSDATLTWAGVRAIGSRNFDSVGTIAYWADAARVSGREDRISYSSVDEVSTVTGVRAVQVRGSAFDVGVTWESRLPASPSVTIGLARGSGGERDGVDRSFRQTGLQNNKWRYGGVNRFRYYGEVLRPELSNLQVTTVSAGVPLLRNSSIEVGWHRYRQSVAADSMRDLRIDLAPTGQSRDLGRAIDVVLGFRDSRTVDVEMTVGLFEAGGAYGPAQGRRAWLYLLESTWNF